MSRKRRFPWVILIVLLAISIPVALYAYQNWDNIRPFVESTKTASHDPVSTLREIEARIRAAISNDFATAPFTYMNTAHSENYDAEWEVPVTAVCSNVRSTGDMEVVATDSLTSPHVGTFELAFNIATTVDGVEAVKGSGYGSFYYELRDSVWRPRRINVRTYLYEDIEAKDKLFDYDRSDVAIHERITAIVESITPR